jgi:hypothetical protein
MCDYSLHGIENRLAEEGEVLVVHRFYSGSKGLTSPEYLKPAEPPKGWMAILKRTLADQSRVCAVAFQTGLNSGSVGSREHSNKLTISARSRR